MIEKYAEARKREGEKTEASREPAMTWVARIAPNTGRLKTTAAIGGPPPPHTDKHNHKEEAHTVGDFPNN